MRLAPRSRHITACQQPIGPVPRITTVSPSRTSSISTPFSAQANGSATVARSEGRHVRALGGGAGKGVVAIEEVVRAEVLEPVHAPAALAAREDGAEEYAVPLRDAGRQDGLGPDLLEHADRLRPRAPRRRP